MEFITLKPLLYICGLFVWFKNAKSVFEQQKNIADEWLALCKQQTNNLAVVTNFLMVYFDLNDS